MQSPLIRMMEESYIRQGMREIYRESKIHEVSIMVATALTLSGKTFTTLNESKQAVGEIYKHQQALGLLPELKAKKNKSNEATHQFRIRGNEAYKDGDLKEALRFYTRAVCWAQADTKEMAMAYANRSAVTFQLQKYQDAIDDITRAFSSGKYPESLKHKLLDRRIRCCMALGQYTKATADCKRLIVLTLKTEIDLEKLNTMRAYLDMIAECMGKQETPKPTVQTPKLTHKPSPYIQCASSAVDIRCTPEMGRCIVAAVDIKPGDILAIERPFAAVLYHDYWVLFCNYCKKRCNSSIPCLSCTEVVFCSEKCREISWAECHSVECDVLQHLIDLGCDRYTYILAIQTLLKVTKVGENLQLFIDDWLKEEKSVASGCPEKVGFVNGKYLSDHYKAIQNLVTHEERRPQQLLLKMAADVSFLIHVLKEATTFFAPTDTAPNPDALKPVSGLQLNHIVAADLLLRYMMASNCNAYHIETEQWIRYGADWQRTPEIIGSAIYPFLSLLNHSCNPDVDLIKHNGDTTVMMATKPIREGEQVFINYGLHYHKQRKAERQAALRKVFHFTCQCDACLEDWPTFNNIPDAGPLKFLPSATPNNKRQVFKSCAELYDIFLRAGSTISEEHFTLFIKHLTMINKYVKRPCKLLVMCENVLSNHASFTYNLPGLKETP